MPNQTNAWVEPHPEIPYRTKPDLRPADWLVEHPPVTPDASSEAQALLHYLYSISGTHTLTGQHNYAGRRRYTTDLVTRLSGKTPALYGTDWGFAAEGDKDTAFERDAQVQELIQRWQGGAVVTLCWHAVPPTEDEPVTFGQSVQGSLTDAQFDEVLTPGSALHGRWCAQVDAIAVYLKQLQEARVPVLWRPYHEINGDWFWWTGRRGECGSAALYRQIYGRLVNTHGLNNLLWVWNPDRPARADRQFVDYFPGHDCVDVLALDSYGPFEQSYYDDLNALSDGKVMAISETYHPPPPDAYRTQPKWAFYMIWAVDTPEDGGRPGGFRADGPDLRALMDSSRMLSLGDPAYRAGINRVRTACGLEPLPMEDDAAPER